MLQELSIKNFAIIDDLRISFAKGLTILSGETGAGKSVIINAVNLLLGSRASSGLIRTGAQSAELEALFSVDPQSETARSMNTCGFDAAEGLVIRRVIARNDRHRIYANGRLATMQQLNAFSANLASISGQHAHQGLLQGDQQLLILDQFGGLMPLRHKVAARYHATVPLIQALHALQKRKQRQSEHLDLLAYQRQEIIAAGINAGEDQRLEQEQLRLKNAVALSQSVHSAVETLYGAPGAVVEQLVTTRKELEQAAALDGSLAVPVERVSDVALQLEDIARDLQSYLKNITLDQNRLETVADRLDILTKLKRKYGGDLAAVTAHLAAIENELDAFDNLDDTIARARERLATEHTSLAQLVRQLSDRRKATARKLARKVMAELETLKMMRSEFRIDFERLPTDAQADPFLTVDGHAVSDTGLDRIVFMIAPNVGETLKSLASIASGGELSRVVLALKAILAQSEAVATIVFDEVDAGIGGGVAEVVGQKLVSLAAYHQVICITHLPQIARYGDHHFKIGKHVRRGRTRTTIEPVTAEERIREIARMLAGDQVTHTTLAHARELLTTRPGGSL